MDQSIQITDAELDAAVLAYGYELTQPQSLREVLRHTLAAYAEARRERILNEMEPKPLHHEAAVVAAAFGEAPAIDHAAVAVRT